MTTQKSALFAASLATGLLLVALPTLAETAPLSSTLSSWVPASWVSGGGSCGDEDGKDHQPKNPSALCGDEDGKDHQPKNPSALCGSCGCGKDKDGKDDKEPPKS